MPRSSLAALSLALLVAAPALGDSPMISIAIHGGAGVINRAALSAEAEQSYRADLARALDAGYDVLADGGSSMDAAIVAVKILEDSPLFNAGRGAVFNSEGVNELDASVMDGATLRAGAVAGLRHVRNPIGLARLVMERSSHVLLAGAGAEEFALEHGVELVPRSWFHTDRRWQQLEQARRGERLSAAEIGYYGTVGAVALDAAGNLAAATSTGGMTNKRWGRVGDSPIIGAGTYAENESCAVSATGHGEYFIRAAVAYDICARMKYLGETLQTAADQVIMEKLVEMGATGGVVALDRQGNIAMPFNTAGMYRGYVDTAGNLVVEIYRD
jgi:L-asparaginase / beta-aspartyl-peptidase